MKPTRVVEQVNIKQVAREAGVSTQTVSRVINNRPDVAPETRERVQATVVRLGYRPNAMARSLIARRSHTLGIITDTYNDVFFMQVITGAEAEARRHGYRFLLNSSDKDNGQNQEYIRLVQERFVDGVLVVRHSDDKAQPHLIELLKQGLPVATTAYYLPGELLTVVDVDNLAGAYGAVRHLIEHGHHQIAQITGPLTMKAAADRSAGYLRALREIDVLPHPHLLVEGEWTYRSGYSAAKQLLQRQVPFTAVFAHNDEMAIAAIYALHEAGLRVPDDVSVIGYDGIPVGEYSIPPLTTVRQPIREIGRLATQLLIQQVEGIDVTPSISLLQTELVVRRSVVRNERLLL
jgi:DNA-binding LacI/PurR family transcriptional regulator